MKTAVIYARYSSDSQSEQSIEGQLRVCNEYAKNNDILILKTYIDRAMTGTNDNRPDFQQMLKDSNRREWDYVLVYKFDRFSRNKYETAMHKKTLKDNGVKVISATEYIPDSPEAIILESMLEGYAEYYSAELSQKVKRGMNESRIKGNYTGGRVLFGYKVANHKVLIDEQAADIVRCIFKQYAGGKFVKDIAKEFNRKGIFINGKKWTASYIYNILKNEKYSGVYHFKDETFNNMYPQIVDINTYEKVRIKAAKNEHGSRSVKTVYLLRHKLKCGYCGSYISAESGTAKNGSIKYYYKCLAKKRGSDCAKQQVRKDVLEQYVLKNIYNYLTDKDNLDYVVEILLKRQEENTEKNLILTQLIKEKRQTENAINNIMTAIENGGTSNTAMKRLRELEEKNESLEREIILEKAKNSSKLTREMIIDYYKEALRQEPLMLITLLVKEITLFNDKMVIQFNTPTATSPDESRGFNLYSDNVKYPVYIMKKKIPVMIDFELIIKV